MKVQLKRALAVGVFVIIFGVLVNGQSGPLASDSVTPMKRPFPASSSGEGNAVLKIAGKVSVVIVKSAAKTAWATTKFAAKDVAKPILVGIAKPLLLKATPQITMFALKLTGKSLQKGIPIATKLGMTYLRAKLPF